MKHARQSNVPIVVDGDGLFLVTNCLDLVKDYQLAVLTPNVNEYKRLIQKVLNCEVNYQDGTQQLLSLAKGLGGVTILRKGESDYISNGEEVSAVNMFGSPRRCGGQGDILSGSVAVFLSWARQRVGKGGWSASPTILGCIAGSAILRKAASLAFENKRRSTLTSDIIECLGESLDELSPVSY
ncbi:ATP-dependent (S)-NAD(P)H-hydrate dehydratase [Abeliophyllum distichum]|uniref:ATP-dependent (S)-NAD(P)H-hydrate dehydratase n=1 Tax=Abeliophyllum distichum TaxID=126358 RepID=A0ABD1SB61_9LAMI